MCTANAGSGAIGRLNPFSRPLGSTTLGKINSTLDPAGAYISNKAQEALFPAPVAVAPPPGVQDSKDPDLTLLTKARKDSQRAGPSTLLTGSSGVARGSQTFGSTLLGG